MKAEKKQIKELVVSAIENGTVIDHIPTHRLFQVINILNLNQTENNISGVCGAERAVFL